MKMKYANSNKINSVGQNWAQLIGYKCENSFKVSPLLLPLPLSLSLLVQTCKVQHQARVQAKKGPKTSIFLNAQDSYVEKKKTNRYTDTPRNDPKTTFTL